MDFSSFSSTGCRSDFLELRVLRALATICSGSGSGDGGFSGDSMDFGDFVGDCTGTIGGEAGGMTASLVR